MIIVTEIKNMLYRKLLNEHCFWSFHMDGITYNDVPDEIIVLNTFIHLDMDDINLLFCFYRPSFIKKVWREQMAMQGDYYRALNTFIACYYFHIKHPEKYLKMIERKHLKK